jgi:hypothetical protein
MIFCICLIKNVQNDGFPSSFGALTFQPSYFGNPVRGSAAIGCTVMAGASDAMQAIGLTPATRNPQGQASNCNDN